MKKVFLFLTAFAVSAMMMTACGGNETAATETEVTEEATEVTEETPEVTEETTEATEETTEEVSAAVLGDATHGAEIYNTACMACHAAGVAGAAKLDDKARWDASAAKGLATVYKHAIDGFQGEHGLMPAKGGNTSLSDQDVMDAVSYMFQEAGVEIK